MEMKIIVVLCRHSLDAKNYYEELQETMGSKLTRKSALVFQTEFEEYRFLNINSNSLDGIRAHEFLLSPELLKKGDFEKIKFAINLGRAFTAMYP